MRKNSDGSFDLLIASAVTEVPASGGDIGKETEFELEGGQKLRLVYGDREFTCFFSSSTIVPGIGVYCSQFPCSQTSIITLYMLGGF